MKKLAGRGPLSIVLEPKKLSRLAGAEIERHGERCTDCDDDAPIGWTARRHVGMFVESLQLETSVTHAAARSMDPDAEVEWTVTTRCVPDRAWFGGPTAAGSTLVSGAFAFWVTYQCIEWLPRKPSVHFSLASVILFVTFGITLVLLYAALSRVSKKLIAKLEREPTDSMRARVDRLTAMAIAIPELGLASDEP